MTLSASSHSLFAFVASWFVECTKLARHRRTRYDRIRGKNVSVVCVVASEPNEYIALGTWARCKIRLELGKAGWVKMNQDHRIRIENRRHYVLKSTNMTCILSSTGFPLFCSQRRKASSGLVTHGCKRHFLAVIKSSARLPNFSPLKCRAVA